MQEQVKAVTNEHIKKWLADLGHVSEEVEQLFATLSKDQLTWKPEPGVWSVLECIEHLRVANGLYMPKLQEAVERVKREGKKETKPFRPTWFGRTFIGFVKPESKRKVKTLRPFKPRPALEDTGIGQRFLEQQAQLTELVRSMDGWDLGAGRFASPASRLVRFSVGEAVWMLTEHEKRHLQQAKRLTQHKDFPSV